MADFLSPDKLESLRKESPEIQNQVLDKYFPTLKQETPEIQAQVRQKYGLGLPTANAEPTLGDRAAMLRQQNPIGMATAEASPENPANQMSFGKKLLTSLSNIPTNAADVAKGTWNAVTSPVETGTNLMNLLAGGIASAVPNPTPATAEMAQPAQPIIEGAKQLIHHPVNTVAARIIEKPVSYALDVAAIKGLAGSASKVINPELKTVVKQGIDKAIRPTTMAKRSINDIKVYDNKAVDAVTNIIENKNNLILTTPEGNVFNGLPQTLYQTGEAINQTKSSLWKKIDEMKKATGEAGLTVDTHPLYTELNKIAQDRIVNDLAPDIAKAAQNMAMKYYKGSYTVDEAEKAIEFLNQRLKPFYKNPTYEAAKPAGLDAIVANHLRKGLDEAVTKIKGQGFQEIKNSYGSLKAIEEDVTHRAGIVARQNKAGLVDFSNMYSAAHYMRGIIAMDPASIGTAAAVQAVKWQIKRINNPDRQIASMFKKADKILSQKTAGRAFWESLPTAGQTANMALQSSRIAPQKNSIQDALNAR